MKISETFLGRRAFRVEGRSFELLFTQQPVTVELWRGGEPIFVAASVEQGLGYRVRDADAPFDEVVITTPASETVAFDAGAGEALYRPRAQWFDRNPVKVAALYSNTVAPHAATERFSYTVPVGKKCVIEITNVSVTRTTVAAAPAEFQASITDRTGAVHVFTYAQVCGSGNIVGDYLKDNIGSTIVLKAGDIVASHTLDASTGGTVTYRISLKGTEFNA